MDRIEKIVRANCDYFSGIGVGLVVVLLLFLVIVLFIT